MPDTEKRRTAHAIGVHLAKLCVGVVIVAVILWRYDFREVWPAIVRTDLSILLIAWLFALASMMVLALMLRVALRPLRMPLSTFTLLKINFQIRFYGLFLPGAANFFIKWYKIAKPGRQPGQALALMAFTRMTHMLALLAVSAVGIWCDSAFPWPTLRITILVLLGAVCLALTPFVLQDGRRTTAMLRRLASRFPMPGWVSRKISKMWSFLRSFSTFSWAELFFVFALPVGAHVLDTYAHVCLAQSVGICVSPWVFAWLRGVILVCALIPFSFSGLGFREVSVVALLVFYGVPEEQALAYSLLYFAAMVLIKGLVGGLLELKDQIALFSCER